MPAKKLLKSEAFILCRSKTNILSFKKHSVIGPHVHVALGPSRIPNLQIPEPLSKNTVTCM